MRSILLFAFFSFNLLTPGNFPGTNLLKEDFCFSVKGVMFSPSLSYDNTNNLLGKSNRGRGEIKEIHITCGRRYKESKKNIENGRNWE